MPAAPGRAARASPHVPIYLLQYSAVGNGVWSLSGTRRNLSTSDDTQPIGPVGHSSRIAGMVAMPERAFTCILIDLLSVAAGDCSARYTHVSGARTPEVVSYFDRG